MSIARLLSKRPYRRARYVVDRVVQVGFAARLVLVLLSIGSLFSLGVLVFLFLGDDLVSRLSGSQVRAMVLTACGVYFFLALASVFVASLLLTHRFAGPVRVLRHALEGMLVGDTSRRVTLRQGDYLQDLAATVGAVRDAWVRREAELRETVARIDTALDQGDLEGARQELCDLLPRPPETGETEGVECAPAGTTLPARA